MLEEFTRWTKKRKAAVLILIEKGELTVEECMERFNMSFEELGEWNQIVKQEDYFQSFPMEHL